jgi:hypothetical protein
MILHVLEDADSESFSKRCCLTEIELSRIINALYSSGDREGKPACTNRAINLRVSFFEFNRRAIFCVPKSFPLLGLRRAAHATDIVTAPQWLDVSCLTR